MKVVFLSNFYNHHQMYISRNFYNLTDGNYRFIATEQLPEERMKMGYQRLDESFVLQYGMNESVDRDAQVWIDSADIVIIGSAPEKLLKNRKKQKKIICRYSERPLKNGFEWWKYLLRWWRWHRSNPYNMPIYLLCSSAYTASDYLKFGLFRGRSFKWGYFPECKRYDDFESVMSQKSPKEILWCGRYLDWKYPDAVLQAAKQLKKEKYDFHINFVGTGPMECELRTFCTENDLDDVVTFNSAVSPEGVRKFMEKAGIYLFTSGRKEGWGAVLNEAMNSGCAVVANLEAGATPYLIDDHTNGLAYNEGNVNELYCCIKCLLASPEKQQELGRAAYYTIINKWNADVAAERAVHFFEQILKDKKEIDIYDDGPFSNA